MLAQATQPPIALLNAQEHSFATWTTFLQSESGSDLRHGLELDEVPSNVHALADKVGVVFATASSPVIETGRTLGL